MKIKKDKTNYVSNSVLYKQYIEWHAEIEEALKTGKEPPQVSKPIVESMMKICNGLSFNPYFLNYSFKDDMVGDALYDCIRFANKFNPHKLIYKIKIQPIEDKFEKGHVIIGNRSGTVGKLKFINYNTGISSYTPINGEYFIAGEDIKCVNSSACAGIVLDDVTHKANNPFSFITTIAHSAFLRRIDAEKKQTYIKAKILSETPIHEFFEQLDGDDTDIQQSFVEFLNENSDNMVNNEPMAVKRKRKKAADKLSEDLNIEELDINDESSLDRFAVNPDIEDYE